VAKLKELNPAYDGMEDHKIEDGQVVQLTIRNAIIADLSPVRALAKLRTLRCEAPGTFGAPGSPLADLTPLRGLPLETLNLPNCRVSSLDLLRGMRLRWLMLDNTKVSDLSPLQGMPLNSLNINNTPVSDLSPLRGTPLESLFCANSRVKDLSPLKDTPLKEIRYFCNPKRDAEVLRSIKTLRKINGLRLAEFWKQVEAGKMPSPNTNP